MRETAKVLRRFQWQEDEIVRYLKLIAKVAEIVTPTIAVDALSEDETDHRTLECAVAGDGALVVSGDRHLLLRLKSFEGIGIVRPVDFHPTFNRNGLDSPGARPPRVRVALDRLVVGVESWTHKKQRRDAPGHLGRIALRPS
jgi:hypothetical protein